MSYTELQLSFNDYKSTIERYFDANNERLKQIERKSVSDPLTDQKINKLNDAIDSLEGKMGEIKTAMQRPMRMGFDAKNQTPHEATFMNYLKKGIDTGLETKALSVGSEPDGGYLVPRETFGRIIKTLSHQSAMRKLANCVTVSSDSLDLLADKDEFGAGWVAETAQRDETDTAKLAKIRIPVHEQYAEPRITQKLLDDANINVEEWLIQKIVEKMGKVEEQSFIRGDGNGCPRGILSYEDGMDWGQIKRFKTGVDGGFNDDHAADILYEALYGLESGYLQGASWLLSRSTLARIRKMKDNEGHYLWQPSMVQGEPSTLLGHPIHMSDAMPNIANDALPIAFGNFKEAYTIVDRFNVRILRDPFTAKPYVKFYTTKRVGGDVTNFKAIKLIQTSA
ncbi:MAG: phage major capsid protein [Alphaproteobacteria bacterium]|nr:phage major capsid protein [Alphaproteobacteria bacterium]